MKEKKKKENKKQEKGSGVIVEPADVVRQRKKSQVSSFSNKKLQRTRGDKKKEKISQNGSELARQVVACMSGFNPWNKANRYLHVTHRHAHSVVDLTEYRYKAASGKVAPRADSCALFLEAEQWGQTKRPAGGDSGLIYHYLSRSTTAHTTEEVTYLTMCSLKYSLTSPQLQDKKWKWCSSKENLIHYVSYLLSQSRTTYKAERVL